MPRSAFNVRARIVEVVCNDEADGPGTAEPYLWPVFFKVDGDSYAVDAFGLIGFPTVTATNGDHANLAGGVGDGDHISVPEELGTKTMLLKPIPVNDPSYRIVLKEDDFPGVIGILAVLMEEDSWPDNLPAAGYEALADAVHLGVAKALASFQHNAAKPSKEEMGDQIALIKPMVKKMVRGAILNAMTGTQIARFGSVSNNDDQIGTETWFVDQDDFASVNTIKFTKQWKSEETDGAGDWSITVEFTNMDAPSPNVDPKQCSELLKIMESLQEDLKGDIEINEAKTILKEIGKLKDKSQLLGCPRL